MAPVQNSYTNGTSLVQGLYKRCIRIVLACTGVSQDVYNYRVMADRTRPASYRERVSPWLIRSSYLTNESDRGSTVGETKFTHGWAHARASRHLSEVRFLGKITWPQGFQQGPPVAGHLLDGNLQ